MQMQTELIILLHRVLQSGKPETFLNTLKKNSEEGVPGLATSMCGWTSGLTLLYLTEGNKNIEIKHIDYCNSGDSRYGNKNEVVGYHAFAVIDKQEKSEKSDNNSTDIVFTEAEKNQLFKIAEKSIRTMLYENKRISLDEKEMTGKPQKTAGGIRHSESQWCFKRLYREVHFL